MRRLASIAFAVCLAVAAWTGSTWANDANKVGIDRSNLTWEPVDKQAATLRGIEDLGAHWFRDGLSGVSPQTNEAFVRELKMAKDDGLQFLAAIQPKRPDFPDGYQNPNAGPEFARRCGWEQGSPEFSKVEPERLEARLRAQFDAIKAAGLSVDAFEIGNESDWICFNGDVPDGHVATAEEFRRLVVGYAAFLRTAATVIHDKAYFPQAKIITFGISHVPDSWDVGHHVPDPDRILTALRNLDGFDYLDNPTYHVAGVGSHLYPPIDDINGFVATTVAADSRAAGGKPVWITEWGFNIHKFARRADMTRAQAITRFYQALDSQPTPLGPNFFYAYSEAGHKGMMSLVDADGNALPEASAVANRAHRP